MKRKREREREGNETSSPQRNFEESKNDFISLLTKKSKRNQKLTKEGGRLSRVFARMVKQFYDVMDTTGELLSDMTKVLVSVLLMLVIAITNPHLGFFLSSLSFLF